jgi:phage terminase large subunit-like protein
LGCREASRDRRRWVDFGRLAPDEIMRLHTQSAVIENGFVHVPAEAPWLAGAIAELTVFPMGRRHHVQFDSTS